MPRSVSSCSTAPAVSTASSAPGGPAVRTAVRDACSRFGAAALLGLLLLVAGPSRVALGHELRPAVADLELAEETLHVVLRVNVEALIADIGIEHDDTDESSEAAAYDALRALEPEALRERLDEFVPTLLDALELRRADGERLPLALADVELPPIGDVREARDSTLRLTAAAPGTRAITWHWPERFGPAIVRSADPDAPDAFGVYVLAGETSDPLPLGGGTSADPGTVPDGAPNAGPDAAADRADAAASRDGSLSWRSTALGYVRVGFVHIVPKGLDHILFVVGLFLLAPRWRPMLAQVTVFTLAHSVTLALASLGYVDVSPGIVEPLIALSIVAVCAENLFARGLGRARLAVVFAFGLLHGLGFASVLGDVGLPTSAFVISLLAFNVGVEIGQLAVVLVCFAAVGWWFRDAPWYRRVVTVPGSLAIGAIGLWWFAERVLS